MNQSATTAFFKRSKSLLTRRNSNERSNSFQNNIPPHHLLKTQRERERQRQSHKQLHKLNPNAINIRNIIDGYFQENYQHKRANSYHNTPTSSPPHYPQNRFIKRNQHQPRNQIKFRRRSKQIGDGTSRTSFDLINHTQMTKSVKLTQEINLFNIENHQGSGSGVGRYLPPIHQSSDDLEDPAHTFHDIRSTFNSTHSGSHLGHTHISKSKSLLVSTTFIGQVFQISILLQNRIPKGRIKQYIGQIGCQLYNRQTIISTYIKSIISSNRITPIWRESGKNDMKLEMKMQLPIKDMLWKISADENNPSLLRVKTKPLYNLLSANNCAQLLLLLRAFLLQLQPIHGRYINNKLHAGNLFFVQNCKLTVGQWCCSAGIGQVFNSNMQPILKSANQWIATPQYLAPQIITYLIKGAALNEHTQLNETQFPYSSKSDIWSLGLFLLEFITLVPVYIPYKCILPNNRMPRSGILAIPSSSATFLTKLQVQQQKLPKAVKKLLLSEHCGDKIKQLIMGMLQVDPVKRLSLQQIITKIG